MRELGKAFTREEIKPKSIQYDATGQYPWDVARAAWDLGLTARSHIPKEYGGLGLDPLDGVILDLEMAYGCSGIQLAIRANIIGQTPLLLAGSHALKKKYLRPMATDINYQSAYCVSERGPNPDISDISTTAIHRGSEYILNGEKVEILNAGNAKWMFVLARTDPDRRCPVGGAFTGFIVERDMVGVNIGSKDMRTGQRAVDTRTVTFNDVRVPKENVVGAEGLGYRIATEAFAHASPHLTAGAVGLARRALQHATKHTMSQQHGRDVGALAEMALAIETAELSTLKAAGHTDLYDASIAQACSVDVALRATEQTGSICGQGEEVPDKLRRDAKTHQADVLVTCKPRVLIATEWAKRFEQRQRDERPKEPSSILWII